MIKFTVLGEPTGKARPRVTRAGHAYTPEKTAVYENLVKLECERVSGGQFFGSGTPLSVQIVAHFGVPKSASKKKREMMLACEILPTKKPDADNILKIVADALNGVAYADDSQIVTASVWKVYAEIPRVEVTLREL